MSTISVGRVRAVYRGVYSEETAYEFLDWVTSDGSSYVCINENGAEIGTALDNTAYWACLAQKGETGTGFSDIYTLLYGGDSTVFEQI